MKPPLGKPPVLASMKEMLLRWCSEFTEEPVAVVEAQDRAGYIVKKNPDTKKETRDFVSYETCVHLATLMEFLG